MSGRVAIAEPAAGLHLTRRRGWIGAVLLAVVAAALTAAASRHASTTFDEIVLMAGGARGWQTGRWDMAPEHPPLMQYAYGLPIHLTHPTLPPEPAPPETRDFNQRYVHAREFFWASGNDPERLAFLGRLPGALCVALLVLATFGVASRSGAATGLLAAGLVAFLPDVLAHGGVAYNDLPLALAFLASLAAADAAIRKPSIPRGMLAGAALAVALGVKFSAVAALPVIAILIVLEAASRKAERTWRRSLAVALAAGMAATYTCLVALYRGDLALAEMRYGLGFTFGHVSEGHIAPGFLAGSLSATGWTWFFPFAFLLKTPAALHVLLLIAFVVGVRSVRGAGIRALAAAPSRMPVAGLVVFTSALMASSLVIGFRHALPALPLLCMLAAIGAGHAWDSGHRAARLAVGGLLLAHVASSLSAYPHFLGYTSEYAGGHDEGHEWLADSSLDWGQGLLELRDFMREHEIDRVSLSYFGSAVPSGYGINYVPLPSFPPLPAVGPADPPPRWAVISATNLHGIYLPEDPFAAFREREPDAVLAHSLLVYRLW